MTGTGGVGGNGVEHVGRVGTGTTTTTTTTSVSQTIDSLHLDYIFKVVIDTYGRRMATCSADRFVRIWDLQDSGEWALVAQWQAHRGAVTALAFCHPEFGHLLATCGSDNDAIIWEEKTPSATLAASSSSASSVAAAAPGGSLPSRWMSRASLTDARRAVTCVEFAPRHWGLKLAVGSADGCVRIYEAVDIMNLSQWPLAATLQCSQQHCNCLSWCTGRFEPLTLVAGGANALTIFRYVESARAWQSILQLPTPSSSSSLSFPNSTTPCEVLDVSWAANVGRRYHLIAATFDHGPMRVYKLSREIMPASTKTTSAGGGEQQQHPHHALILESTSNVPASLGTWKCQWNVTGTVLASSGDGGVVQLWKSSANGEYVCVSHIQGVSNGTHGNNNGIHYEVSAVGGIGMETG